MEIIQLLSLEGGKASNECEIFCMRVILKMYSKELSECLGRIYLCPSNGAGGVWCQSREKVLTRR